MTDTNNPYAPYADAFERDYFDRQVAVERRNMALASEGVQVPDRSKPYSPSIITSQKGDARDS